MPIGVGLGIAAAISGGASTFGAYESSKASKNAASVQEQAAQQAIALQQNIYNTQVARTQPYVNAGTTSLNNLMAKYWGSSFNDQVASYTQGGRAAGYGYAPPQSGTLSSAAPSPQPYPTLSAPPASGSPMPMSAPPSAAPGAAPGASGGVLMRAPTGETSMVPSNLVQQFIQKGAQVVQQPQMPQPMRMAGTLGTVA